MARYTGPKDRLSRREGVDLFGKGAKLTRLNVPPGMHGPKGIRRNQSQYGKQLREKQKVKRIYGVMERQFKRYVDTALKSKGNTGEALLVLLEKRLDNICYRLGFAKTRPMARQLVSHRHILVDGEKVSIPSYQVKIGQTITTTREVFEDKETVLPAWLERKGPVGRMSRDPKKDDIAEPVSEQDIVEFYSR